MTLCDRKRKILAFRPSVLTYQFNLYQHKQIHTDPTLFVDRGQVSAAQVAALSPLIHLMRLIPLTINIVWDLFANGRNLTFCLSTDQNACKKAVALRDVWQK